MTGNLDDGQDDDVLASLAGLQTCDVSQRRSRRLRRRCHATLQGEPAGQVGRFIVPALGGAWCLAYLLEIIRCTAAIYARFSTP